MRCAHALSFTLCSAVHAANHPDIVRQGFSPDARYHLPLTSFIQYGSGFPSAALQITDVRRNFIVYRQVHVWKEDVETALQTLVAAWRTGKTNILAKYHLTSPVGGEQLFNRPALPLQSYPGDSTVIWATRASLLTLVPLAFPSTFLLRLTRTLFSNKVRSVGSKSSFMPSGTIKTSALTEISCKVCLPTRRERPGVP